MNLVTISDNIAAVASTLSGVRGASGQGLDTIPVTPYVVVGLPTGLNVIPGNRQVTNIDFPLHLYIERVSGEKRDIRALYNWIPTFVNAYAADQSLGNVVSDCYITAWDTNVVDTVGGEDYRVVDFTLSVTVHEAITQALRTVI